MKTTENGRRIYLDYAASTPVDEKVRAAMEPYFSEHFGNPGGLHHEARVAKEAVDVSREHIARDLGAHAHEIIFTSGGTESNTLGIMGVINHLLDTGRDITSMHLITSAIEHPSAFAAFQELQEKGAHVSFIGVSHEGILDLSELEKALKKETVLVSVMQANNEIGTIQPIEEIAKLLRAHRKKHESAVPYFHVDASQVPSYLDVGVEKLGVDLMSLDAQKIYGPKGIGVLYKRKSVPLKSLFYGGRQEWGLRSGTENVPLIVGMAEALTKAIQEREHESTRVSALRDYFIDEVEKKIPSALLNGHRTKRLANNVNFYIPGVDNEWLVITLDAHGIAIGSKSACHPVHIKDSHVVEALGRDKQHAKSSFRFTLGRATTQEDLDYVVDTMSTVIVQAHKEKEEVLVS